MHTPYETSVVKTQLDDAQSVLTTQFGVQEKMLDHQKTAQLNMLEAEKNRMLSIMTTQYEQQYTQQKLSIEQAWKQQQPHALDHDDPVRAAVHAAEAVDRAGLEAAALAARDGKDPARHGHPAAGRADDGAGPAVPDGRGDAAEHGEGLRQRLRGRCSGRQGPGGQGPGGCQGQVPGQGQEVDAILGS